MHRKLVVVLWLALALTIFITGCSTGQGPHEVILESGAINTDYMGDPDPQLVVEMKLTPEEQAGNFEKVPVKTKSSMSELQAEIKEDSTTQEAGGADTPRPKI